MSDSKIENVVLGTVISVIVYSMPICFILFFRHLLNFRLGLAVTDITIILLNLFLLIIVLYIKKNRTIAFDLAYFITQIIILLPVYMLCSAFLVENDLVFAVQIYQAICILNVCLLIAFLFFRLYGLIKKINIKNENQKL